MKEFSFIQSFLLVGTIIDYITFLVLVETVFLASKRQFFPLFRYSWLWKQFLREVETYFLTNYSFQLVKRDFLSCGKSIFFFIQNFAEAFEIWRCQFLLVSTDILIFWLAELIFPICQTLLLVKEIFRFLNKSPNPYGRDVFSVLWKPFSLIWCFFLQVETVTEIGGNLFFFNFFEERLSSR